MDTTDEFQEWTDGYRAGRMDAHFIRTDADWSDALHGVDRALCHERISAPFAKGWADGVKHQCAIESRVIASMNL